jgi:hypothetical protein
MTFIPSLTDLHGILQQQTNPAPSLSSILSDIFTWLQSLSIIPRIRVPFLTSSTARGERGITAKAKEIRRRRARVMLGLVEVMGEVVLDKWAMLRRLEDDEENGVAVAPKEINRMTFRRKTSRHVGQGVIEVSDIESSREESEEEIDGLQRRRGASPTPARYPESMTDTSKPHISTGSSITRAESAEGDSGSESSDSTRSITDDIRITRSDAASVQEGKYTRAGKAPTLHSEKTDGWNLYLSVLGMVVLSYIWGTVM